MGTKGSSTGTAFAITDDGWWLTARHVAHGCDTDWIQAAPRKQYAGKGKEAPKKVVPPKDASLSDANPWGIAAAPAKNVWGLGAQPASGFYVVRLGKA